MLLMMMEVDGATVETDADGRLSALTAAAAAYGPICCQPWLRLQWSISLCKFSVLESHVV